MPDLDDVIARLHDDPEFRDALTRQPRDALSGYRLSRDDLEALSARLAASCECTSLVDVRSALAGLLRLLALTAAAPPDPAEV